MSNKLEAERWRAGHIRAGWWQTLEEADPLLLEGRGLVGQLTEIPLKLATAAHACPLCPHPSRTALGAACQHSLMATLCFSFSLGASSVPSPSGLFRTIIHPDASSPLKRDRQGQPEREHRWACLTLSLPFFLAFWLCCELFSQQ